MTKNFYIILFTCSYALGLIAFLTDNIFLFSCIFFILIILSCFKKVLSEKFAVIIFLIFAIGILNCSLRVKTFDCLNSVAPQNDISLTGRVISLPSSNSDFYTKFVLNVCSYKLYNQKEEATNAKTMVTLFVPKEIYKKFQIGDIISLKGRLAKTKTASNPSEFCYATYLRLKNIHSRFYVQDNNFKIISPPDKLSFKFISFLNNIRNEIITAHSKNIKSPELELLGGIIFGDDAVNPTEEMKLSFQNSGLTHIIAASGMNVSMIFGMWFFISQIFKLNYKLSILTGIFSIICYTCMTGFGPPVMRASLMLIFILLGKLINRKVNSISLLFIVAFIMLLISPAMITNIGFQLSFAVTFGLLLISPLLFKNVKNKILSTFLSFIFIPIIAQIFAAPIQSFYFNSFSPYSVFANISVVPTLSIVSFAGFTSCIFAIIKPISSFCVKIFDIILMPFLSYITNVAEFFSNLKYANITVPSPSVIQIFFYYLLIILLTYLFISQKHKKIFSICIFLSIFILSFSFIDFDKNKNEIIFFSVENADAAFIKTSKNIKIMIDAGKLPYKEFSNSAERIILKYFKDKGIKSIDYLILSHFDSDHSGGALNLMNEINVKNLVVRKKDDTSPLAKQIYNLANEKSIPIIMPKYNEKLFDDGKNRMFSLFIEKGDDNATSIINLFEYEGGKVLFTGDSGIESFLDCKKNLPKNIQILKVAHHGAEKTLSSEYLEYLKPKFAVISTGQNIYGHPAKNTIHLLKHFKVKILRTDIDNAIKFVLYKNKILMYSYNNKRKIFERINYDNKS